MYDNTHRSGDAQSNHFDKLMQVIPRNLVLNLAKYVQYRYEREQKKLSHVAVWIPSVVAGQQPAGRGPRVSLF